MKENEISLEGDAWLGNPKKLILDFEIARARMDGKAIIVLDPKAGESYTIEPY